MPIIDITVGGETIELEIGEHYVDMLEDVNDALDREMSLGRFAAQALRSSETALEQSVERSIVHQDQALREAEKQGIPPDELAQALEPTGRGED